MTLPPGFQFSQASLQDYVDCPRRFQLRYLLALQWPAVQAEPVEEHEQRMVLGQAFHRMVQQRLVGLPEEAIARAASNAELLRWWQSFLAYRPITAFCGDQPGTWMRGEYMLAGGVGGHRLVAKYDVLSVAATGQVTILDWKTSTKRTPDDALRERLQTRVYPFLAVQAGAHLNGDRPIDPSHVTLVYWFPEAPGSPARIAYGPEQYAADHRYLTDLIGLIALAEGDGFPMTQDESRCRFCVYRSYCDRGSTAGRLDELIAAWDLGAAPEDIDLDFEQIGEIAF
ncbi:MAG: PD-(D/E)XK nuclease family protein [Anaerolineae bacterium]|nr:PD-(D/E)XK nuclease family protein [Anaerolineae bacterium]